MKQLQKLFDKAVEATMNASGLSFEEFTTSRVNVVLMHVWFSLIT